jgi:ABC-type glycerol-3-phosphate transport system substrate-binding protein
MIFYTHSDKAPVKYYMYLEENNEKAVFSDTACSMITLVFGGGKQATGQADAQKHGTVNLRWALWDWDAVTYYKPLLEAYKVKNPNVNIE